MIYITKICYINNNTILKYPLILLIIHKTWSKLYSLLLFIDNYSLYIYIIFQNLAIKNKIILFYF